MKVKWLPVVLLILVGCGNDGKKPSNNGNGEDVRVSSDASNAGGDAGSDASTSSPDAADAASTSDAGPDVDFFIPPGECGDEVPLNQTITLDGGAITGQFFARAAWDGEGVWVVYNRPGVDGGPEEIFAVRVGCDAEVELGPLQLSETDGNRKYMPAMASRGGRTYVVWAVEQTTGDPQFVQMQGFDRTGSELFAAPIDITPGGAGGAISGLAWEPDVAVFADGSGAVVVSGGGFGAFQIWAQRFGIDGTPSGGAIHVFPEEGIDQKRPSIAAGAEGTLYLSWIRYKAEDAVAGTPEEPERAVFVSIPPGDDVVFPAAPLAAKPLTNPNPAARYAKEPSSKGVHFLAFQVTTNMRADILVRDGTSFDTATTGTFGSQGYINFRPSVAGGENVGVLAWYRYNASPLKNDVMVQSFRRQDDMFVPGPEVHIETELPGIPPYGPDVTWTGGNVYFVVWGEGDTAPQAKVYGRFVGFE